MEGIGFFSKTGRTVYFNGKAIRKVKGISGNYLEIEIVMNIGFRELKRWLK
jgi:hypothetical protein